MEEGDVLDLRVQARDKSKLCFGATIGLCNLSRQEKDDGRIGSNTYLAFVKDFLRDFILEGLRRFLLLQDLVLTEGQEAFK